MLFDAMNMKACTLTAHIAGRTTVEQLESSEEIFSSICFSNLRPFIKQQ